MIQSLDSKPTFVVVFSVSALVVVEVVVVVVLVDLVVVVVVVVVVVCVVVAHSSGHSPSPGGCQSGYRNVLQSSAS